MESRHYWEENGLAVKYDNYNSNDGFGRANGEQGFAPPSEDETEYPAGAYLKKGKVSRQDPMSHRIIEKRRRDRMNNCLADLSRLIPPEYLKKGRGRVEKTEIIEMAIRHLKFLQERVNERQTGEENFRAGYQEAMGEAVRFLVEVQGHGPGDGLCVQLATHLQRHCELVTKGTYTPPTEEHSRAGFQQAMGEALRFLAEEQGLGSDRMRVQLATHLQRHCELITNGEGHARDKQHSHLGSSSETASSSSSSQGYGLKGVIHRLDPPPAFAPEPYEPERTADAQYAMDDAMGPLPLASDARAQEPLALDARRKREPTLRKVRKLDHTEDYLHSYKFKNSIERRFSRSQDNEAAEVQARAHPHGKPYGHKRRRAGKPPPVASTSTSNSGSTEEARDTSPQDTSSESPHHHQFDVKAPAQYVPVFALNALGKYYVPLSVEYSCLARHLGPYDVLDARAVHLAAPLHPVTIHVNFQPCLNYHVKREPTDRDWRPV